VATADRLILVDTNVLLDVAAADPRWADWSQGQLDVASARDRLAINAVVYAELAAGYDSIEALEAALARFELDVTEIPRLALFLAGKAFRDYRRKGGVRTGVLADFFIGAHAVVEGWTLITRDPVRYRTYFPTIELIAPDRQ
jgi:predicted nucleic acid-binding protein